MISSSFLLSDALIQTLGWTLLHSLWQGSALALVLWLVLPRLRKAKQRYWVSYTALVSVLIAAVISFTWVYNTQESTVGLASEWGFALEDSSAAAGIDLAAESAGFWQALSETLEPYNPVIVTIWLLGFLFFLLQLVGSLHYVYRLRRRQNQFVVPEWQEKLQDLASKIGYSKPVDLLESALIKSPMALGLLKPLILLPIGMINQLDPAEVEAILAHELAHIARRDWLFNLFQALIETVFYFHPAVWWIATTIRTERENCCDDVAVQVTGNRLVYAKTLVRLQDIAKSAHSPALALSLEGSPNLLRRRPLLLERIKRILHQPQQSSSLMEKTIALGILVALITLWSVRANTPPALKESLLEIAETPLSWFEAAPQNEQTFQVVGDTVPKPKKRQRIVQEDDNKHVEMELEDGEITKLKIDGKEIKAAEYAQYKEITESLRQEAIPPPPPPAPNVENIFGVSVFPTAPNAPFPPGTPSRIRTETDEKGNTLIHLEQGGKPMEIRVKDGEVWIDDKKMEEGESLDLPGGNEFFFRSDGNNNFRIKGNKFMFQGEDGVIIDVPEPSAAPHFRFEGDDGTIFEVPEPGNAPRYFQFENGNNQFFFKDGNKMTFDFPELEFSEKEMKEAYKEALKGLEEQQIIIEKELRENEKASKRNKKEWKKQRAEQLKELEEARKVIIEIQKAEHENMAHAQKEYARASAEARKLEREVQVKARKEYKRAMADAQRANKAYYRVAREQNQNESTSSTLRNALLKDKLITDPDNYSFELSSKSMRVNGKKQTAATHKRYLDIYQKKSGKAIGKGKVKIEVKN